MSKSLPIAAPSVSLECQTATQFPAPSLVTCDVWSLPESVAALVLRAAGGPKTCAAACEPQADEPNRMAIVRTDRQQQIEKTRRQGWLEDRSPKTGLL